MSKKIYKINERSALVLEGGGMRGVFTSGVLDNLMDRGIRFPYTIGVSAGACNGLSYISNQRGRAKFSNIDLLAKYKYIGLRHLLTKRNIMDFDLLFHKFPQEIIPYDYDFLANCPEHFEMVTTVCSNGTACYLEEKMNPDRVIDIVKASSSLPFVCPKSCVDGVPMLDGGIADSIPVKRAIKLGYDNVVVVLTRNKGYRKPNRKSKIPPFVYLKYPALREAIAMRNIRYNEQLDYIESLEEQGKIIVIRPIEPIVVDRLERDIAKLTDLYNQGYKCAQEIIFE